MNFRNSSKSSATSDLIFFFVSFSFSRFVSAWRRPIDRLNRNWMVAGQIQARKELGKETLNWEPILGVSGNSNFSSQINLFKKLLFGILKLKTITYDTISFLTTDYIQCRRANCHLISISAQERKNQELKRWFIAFSGNSSENENSWCRKSINLRKTILFF